jgi:hypothetical protein
MTKYRSLASRPEMKPRPWEIHPIWQGIGCVLILLIPIISYAAATLVVDANTRKHWLFIPPELAKTVSLPVIGNVPNLYATLILTGLFILLGYGIIVIIYAVIYRMMAPPRLGPLDAPPIRKSDQRR